MYIHNAYNAGAYNAAKLINTSLVIILCKIECDYFLIFLLSWYLQQIDLASPAGLSQDAFASLSRFVMLHDAFVDFLCE